MKRLCIGLLALVLFSLGRDARAQQLYLDLGDKLTEYPKVEWIKGQGFTKFDAHKIYIIELWATWCKPCIAAMPHLNELHRKFKDKNVVVIAQNVMEDDKQKVEEFVRQQGDGLSYQVAYSGAAGSDFDRRWVKAAGVSSIPATFVIQHNKLVWQTTPYMLNEKVLQLLVEDKFTIEAAKKLVERQP
jgi:thiol-disulfide isomerase/thioredoxin